MTATIRYTAAAPPASYAWAPRVMVERPPALQDQDAAAKLPKRPYIDEQELLAAIARAA